MGAATRSAHIPISKGVLEGDLNVPDSPQGLVLFAHGSGSSKRSPRNRLVAERLNDAGFATLLIDLLTADEDSIDQYTRQFRFDIALLADRLKLSIDWLKQDRQTQNLPLGLFGASTGSAAAIVAAAERPDDVRAVVSRGGRPDLAGSYLQRIRAPILLIVGGADDVVIELNQQSMMPMLCDHKLVVVPNATHLFKEPGALETVAGLAFDWFVQNLAAPPFNKSSLIEIR